MRIREQFSIRVGGRADEQRLLIEAIRELELQRERGEIEDHAYYLKKRTLVKML